MRYRRRVLIALLVAASLCVLAVKPARVTFDWKVAQPTVPALRDLSGRLRLGPAVDARTGQLVAAGATSILYDSQTGRLEGVYVDDETISLVGVLERLVAMKPGLVVAGVAMGRKAPRVPGVLFAVEYYPYGSGFPTTAWGRFPRAQAYILQGTWSGFTGRARPNRIQRAALITRALAHRPMLILVADQP